MFYFCQQVHYVHTGDCERCPFVFASHHLMGDFKRFVGFFFVLQLVHLWVETWRGGEGEGP